MGRVHSAPRKGTEDIDGEKNQRRTYEAFTDSVEMVGKAEVQKDDHCAKHRNHHGMAECVEQTEPHPFAPGALHAGDVGNGRQVVVIEAVAQPKQRAGEQGEFERGRHKLLVGYGVLTAAARWLMGENLKGRTKF